VREDFNSRDMTAYYSTIAIFLGLAWLIGGGGLIALALFTGGVVASGAILLSGAADILRGR
jgi:hypothetical protein